MFAFKTEKGLHGFVEEDDKFEWTDGLLFGGRTWKTKDKRMGRKTVEAAIRRARVSFQHPSITDAEKKKIRSHSARHHSIMSMKEHNVKDEDGMALADGILHASRDSAANLGTRWFQATVLSS